uniref:Uncharacterized protein n=1 Tax=Cacopsylla melanoneura TaxID=428564 RepID=A0A8D8PSG4_9HEMI
MWNVESTGLQFNCQNSSIIIKNSQYLFILQNEICLTSRYSTLYTLQVHNYHFHSPQSTTGPWSTISRTNLYMRTDLKYEPSSIFKFSISLSRLFFVFLFEFLLLRK